MTATAVFLSAADGNHADVECPLSGSESEHANVRFGSKAKDYRRPIVAGHDSQLTGYPFHDPSQAIRGIRQRALSDSHRVENRTFTDVSGQGRAVIQFLGSEYPNGGNTLLRHSAHHTLTTLPHKALAVKNFLVELAQ